MSPGRSLQGQCQVCDTCEQRLQDEFAFNSAFAGAGRGCYDTLTACPGNALQRPAIKEGTTTPPASPVARACPWTSRLPVLCTAQLDRQLPRCRRKKRKHEGQICKGEFSILDFEIVSGMHDTRQTQKNMISCKRLHTTKCHNGEI